MNVWMKFKFMVVIEVVFVEVVVEFSVIFFYFSDEFVLLSMENIFIEVVIELFLSVVEFEL